MVVLLIWYSSTERKSTDRKSTDNNALFNPVMAFMGQKSEEGGTESLEKSESVPDAVKSEGKREVETNSLVQLSTEPTAVNEEKGTPKNEEEEDEKHPETVEIVQDVDVGKPESESETVFTQVTDSMDYVQQRDVINVRPSDEESVKEKSEPDGVEESETVGPAFSHNVVDAHEISNQNKTVEAKDDENAEAEEMAEKVQAEIIRIIQAEVGIEPADANPVRAVESAREMNSNEVSVPAASENESKTKTVEVDQQANDTVTNNKEPQLRSEANVLHSSDSARELEKLKMEMKMMETALQGAARQAQVLRAASIHFILSFYFKASFNLASRGVGLGFYTWITEEFV